MALSADGNTAVVGGYGDNSNIGAAWVFTRSGGVWTQGSKLVGSGNVGISFQGYSVALSADGNTAVVAGWQDNSTTGAVWVFTQSGGVWTQQGPKLVGTGVVANGNNAASQGQSVALSADGNTLAVGGPWDNGYVGATWIFTRSGGVWTQQGSKLVGTGNVGQAYQGTSVALSADGNTLVVGGPQDNTALGAAWVFTRSGGVWTQQGSKLVGTGFAYPASNIEQGGSVALSADGNTAIVGGYSDDRNIGAAWVFTQNGGVWTQQGSKLVGTGYVGNGAGSVFQGGSVSLSGDGNTAVVGGSLDAPTGATWVFARTGTCWAQQGSKLVGSDAVGDADQGISVALSADSNTAMVGGYHDNPSSFEVGVGATWVFAQMGALPLPAVTAIAPTGGPHVGGTTKDVNYRDHSGLGDRCQF